EPRTARRDAPRSLNSSKAYAGSALRLTLSLHAGRLPDVGIPHDQPTSKFKENNMKAKTFVCLLAAGSLGLSSLAFAQPGNHRDNDRRDDHRNEQRHDNGLHKGHDKD